MYRLVLLMALLNVSHCFWGWDHHHDHGKGHNHGHHHGSWRGHDDGENLYENGFEKLARYVIKADNYAHHFCNSHSNGEVQELFENQSYKLIYTVPSSHVNNITVKIKHRVIYMNAKQVNVENPQTFVDLRVLPNMLKTADAWWQYAEPHITVNIPYNMAIQTATKAECRDVTDAVELVQNVPNIIYKFATP